ncbi:response regulator transcription factor [Burkholderia sp. MSMB1835]|uniref:response regulator transcription factor n=1 Tax=Burkholderia sp. MSMB1835 TaxID=1637876 RepID=UPI00075811EB|nr:response regulator transcription factor [Burkholderia sp. MSMB1835]KVL37860.1 LuxR family transcriptional regulator [Burkholderia sp. MSMB1835]
MGSYQIRVVLADDHPAMLVGVEHGLSSVPTIHLAGKAGNSTELIRLLDDGACDVLVSDYAMPANEHGDGTALFSYLQRRYPDVKLVVLTMLDNAAVVGALVRLGIGCIVSKSDTVDHLIPAIHAAATGGTYYSPSVEKVVRTLSAHSSARFVDQAPALSTREIEVVRLYASGMTINEIADKLSRSKKTISTQKSRAMQKLGIDKDMDLLRYAIENGIVAASGSEGKGGEGGEEAGGGAAGGNPGVDA